MASKQSVEQTLAKLNVPHLLASFRNATHPSGGHRGWIDLNEMKNIISAASRMGPTGIGAKETQAILAIETYEKVGPKAKAYLSDIKKRWGSSGGSSTTSGPRAVIVKVTGQKSGIGTLRAYPDGAKNILYQVPLYKVVVEGVDASGRAAAKTFNAYRFGIQLDASRGVNSPRVVGLADKQSHHLKWNYITTMKEMAWRVYSGFFIHRGPASPATSDWGSIGCVEISGSGEWERFNNSVKAFAGSNSLAKIGTSNLLKAVYDAAPRPPLRKK